MYSSVATANVYMAISDGTTTSGYQYATPSNAASADTCQICTPAIFTYGSTANVTFEVYGASGGGGQATLDANPGTTGRLVFTIEKVL